MDGAIMQEVYECLVPVLPDQWQKVVFYAAYTAGSYSMKFFTKTNTDNFEDCFSKAGGSMGQIMAAFSEINHLLTPVRKSLPEEKRWNVFTMSFDDAGRANAALDYSEIEGNVIDYERKWIEKYVK